MYSVTFSIAIPTVRVLIALVILCCDWRERALNSVTASQREHWLRCLWAQLQAEYSWNFTLWCSLTQKSVNTQSLHGMRIAVILNELTVLIRTSSNGPIIKTSSRVVLCASNQQEDGQLGQRTTLVLMFCRPSPKLSKVGVPWKMVFSFLLGTGVYRQGGCNERWRWVLLKKLGILLFNFTIWGKLDLLACRHLSFVTVSFLILPGKPKVQADVISAQFPNLTSVILFWKANRY